MSLLIYLANKGYIKIEEINSKNNKDYKIIKLKEYDGSNKLEKIFFDELFEKSNESEKLLSDLKKYDFKNEKEKEFFDNLIEENIEPNSANKNEIYLSKIKYKFYSIVEKIKNILDSKQNRRTIFATNIFNQKILLQIIIAIIFLVINVIPIFDLEINVVENIGYLGMLILGYICINITFTEYEFTIKSIISEIGIIIFTTLLFLVYPYIKIFENVKIIDSKYVIGYIIGMIYAFIISRIYKKIPKRTKYTDYGKRIFGKIKGFKNFLETAEKEKLETLVMENPTYFYDILPYTYVLGISDKWISKFEKIVMNEPDWYYCDTLFDFNSFNNFVNYTISVGNNISLPIDNYDVSSSGGGSSGGGSGGGGGGSW